jgi:hypothetical protein
MEMEVKVFNLSGALLALAIQYQQMYEPTRSLDWVIEESLVAGLAAKKRSKDYSEQTKNDKAFRAAIQADPLVVLDPKKMTALLVKYKQGGATKGGNPFDALLKQISPEEAAKQENVPSSEPTNPAGA